MLLLISQAEIELDVVVIDDIRQGRKAAVVKEVSLARGLHEEAVLADEYAGKIRGLVDVIGRAVGLEAVDPDGCRSVQIPAGFGPQRLNVTVITLRFSAKQRVASVRRRRVEVLSGLRFRRGNRKLIELQRREPLGNEIFVRVDVREVSEIVRRRNRELIRIVQPRIEEPSLAVESDV